MDYIRSLITYPTSLWTRRLGETPERPAQKSRLINLPAELLLQILGYLELPDDFALSRTCSDLRVLTGRDWQSLVASRLSPARRRDFWMRLALVLPRDQTHGFCESCWRLHRVHRTWHAYGAMELTIVRCRGRGVADYNA
ncbi:hypothetical protein C8034_v012154 [Colletotrichum sidae]|uniref:F-box domain-containing protein n=1 Tax=Colletotrichum sidae TaxID=1347389 RepID=A0A4R8PEC7_9PEZI|nr:hypothetical protein C8034_v012154 [Colletotrichum sidae]